MSQQPKFFKLGDIDLVDAQQMHQQCPDTFDAPGKCHIYQSYIFHIFLKILKT